MTVLLEEHCSMVEKLELGLNEKHLVFRQRAQVSPLNRASISSLPSIVCIVAYGYALSFCKCKPLYFCCA
ncbi:MAG: hypothetical protein RMM29_05275, partial [Planctomycetota bacterium]|nr:hypothetical protein [Planctomycetota bacterium]